MDAPSLKLTDNAHRGEVPCHSEWIVGNTDPGPKRRSR